MGAPCCPPINTPQKGRWRKSFPVTPSPSRYQLQLLDPKSHPFQPQDSAHPSPSTPPTPWSAPAPFLQEQQPPITYYTPQPIPNAHVRDHRRHQRHRQHHQSSPQSPRQQESYEDRVVDNRRPFISRLPQPVPILPPPLPQDPRAPINIGRQRSAQTQFPLQENRMRFLRDMQR